MIRFLRIGWTAIAVTAAVLVPAASYMGVMEIEAALGPELNAALGPPAPGLALLGALIGSMFWWLAILAIWAPGALILLLADQTRRRTKYRSR